ncbi:hypothetical protein ACWGA9_42695 [Streptomyces sp. NPDC054950]
MSTTNSATRSGSAGWFSRSPRLARTGTRPYRERRARLEGLFASGVLTAPFTLCPATTDRATALDWLDPAWSAAGIEGVVVKGAEQTYHMGKLA